MSSTDTETSTRLAGELFDSVVAPLAEARRANGTAPSFPLDREASATTYFVSPDTSVMRAEDFELPGGGEPEGLIDAVVAYWKAHDEADLADAMAERLLPIAEALGSETAEDEGNVDVLCYTLF